MSPAKDFDAAFTRLREILPTNGKDLVVTNDEPGSVNLNSPKQLEGKELFFGGVRVGKRYVSYHLFPVYMFPELLDDVSPDLRKRMQGKSCFNFTAADPTLMSEIETLTQKGLETFKKQNLA